MNNYLSALPDKCFESVINNLNDIIYIEKLKNIYPFLSIRINKYIKFLISIRNNKDKHINFLDYNNCTNLLYASNNILFDIRTPEDLYYLNNIKYVRNINFYIVTKLKDETDSLRYLDAFVKYLTPKIFINKTFRIIFNIPNDKQKNYFAYIFDKKYFTMVNFNQYRGLTADLTNKSKITFQKEILNIFKTYIPSINIYQCLYSSERSSNYLNNVNINLDLLNIDNILSNNKGKNNKLLKSNSIIIYSKIDDYSEIYNTSDIVKQLLKNGNFANFDNSLIDIPNYITVQILKLILISYGESNKILITDNDNDEVYISIWNDPLLNKLLRNIKKSNIEDFKDIAPDFLHNKTKLKSLCNILINFMYPVDIVPFDKIIHMKLPMETSYIDTNINLLENVITNGFLDLFEYN